MHDERPRLLTVDYGREVDSPLDVDEVYVARLPAGAGFQAMRFEGVGSWALERPRPFYNEARADAVEEMRQCLPYVRR